MILQDSDYFMYQLVSETETTYIVTPYGFSATKSGERHGENYEYPKRHLKPRFGKFPKSTK
jgi:hypothetical protein